MLIDEGHEKHGSVTRFITDDPIDPGGEDHVRAAICHEEAWPTSSRGSVRGNRNLFDTSRGTRTQGRRAGRLTHIVLRRGPLIAAEEQVEDP